MAIAYGYDAQSVKRINSAVLRVEMTPRDETGLKYRPTARRAPAYTPAIVKVTVLHDNYAEAHRWRQALDTGTGRYTWAIDTAHTFNVALPLDIQRQFWDGVTQTDPLDGSNEVTFTRTGPQARDADNGSVIAQRVIPWLDTDTTDAPPLLCLPMPMHVPNDDDDADVLCSHIIVGPHMWTRVV